MMAWAKMKVAAGVAILCVFAGLVTLEVRAQTRPSQEAVAAPAHLAGATKRTTSGDVETQGLLVSAQAASAWTERATSTVRVTMRGGFSGPPAFTTRLEQTARCFRAHDGRSHTKLELLSAERDGKSVGPARIEEILADKEHIRYVGSGASALQLDPNVQWDRELGRVEWWRKLNLASVETGGFLDGMVADVEGGPESVIELSRKGTPKLASGVEVVDGIECRLVESETPAGLVRIWVAPSRGNNIAKFTVGRPSVVAKDSENVEMVFDQAKFAEVGGRTVVAGGHFQEKHGVTQSGHYRPLWEQETTAVRSEIELNPLFDEPGLFTLSGVPDGTAVTIVGSPDNHGYVWRGGKPVKK